MSFPKLDPAGKFQFAGPINETKGPPYRVMIARFPGNNSEHPASSGYVMKLIESITRDFLSEEEGDGGTVSSIVPHKEIGTPITCLRNKTVGCAIAADCDYLLMIDSDMDPDIVPGAPLFWDTAWKFMINRQTREGMGE